MRSIFAYIRRAILGGKRQRSNSLDALHPRLNVRPLEDRYVLHAGPLTAGMPAGIDPAQQGAAVGAASATTISIDSSHNLHITDSSTTGQNDQLQLSLDSTGTRLEIYDPSQTLRTEIAGAEYDGDHRVFIPLAAFQGGNIVVSTGLGNDAVSLDLSRGALPGAVQVDGGAGSDSLTFVGGQFGQVSYSIGAGGGQLQTSGGQSPLNVSFVGIEPIRDLLQTDSRQFTMTGSGLTTLQDNGVSGDGVSLLTYANGGSIAFVNPRMALSIVTPSAESAGSITGLDSQYRGDVAWQSGGSLSITGNLQLDGGDFTAHASRLQFDGSIATHHAVVELAATGSTTLGSGSIVRNSEGFVSVSAGGTARVAGTIDVAGWSATGHGGEVRILGDRVELVEQASIDASGSLDGGVVHVGGSYQGHDRTLQHARETFVSEQVSIRANATVRGDGGTIIVWADETATVLGSGNLQAHGGAVSGNGGLIETSGKLRLIVGGAASASAPNGAAGVWLLDPRNVRIVNNGTGVLTAGTFNPTGAVSTIDAGTIETALNGGTNVRITTNDATGLEAGNITVDEAISVTTAGTGVTLTLDADNNIVVNQAITSTGRALTVRLLVGGLLAPIGVLTGDVTINAAITTNGGDFISVGDDFTSTAVISTNGGNVSLTQDGDVSIQANLNAAAGNVTIDTDSGFIVLVGNTTITGTDVSLVATGTITSGSAGNDIDASDDVTVQGSSIGAANNDLRVKVAGDVSLRATSGDVQVVFTSGDFATSQLTSLRADGNGAVVSLTVAAGAFNVDSLAGLHNSTANDNFRLNTTGANQNITFSAPSALAAASVIGNSAGAILGSGSNTATDINTSALDGDIQLISVNGVGTLGGTPVAVRVSAGDGIVSASSTTSSGDINILAAAALNLGAITTAAGSTQGVQLTASGTNNLRLTQSHTSNDAWTLISGQDIVFSSSTTLAAASANLQAARNLVGSSADVEITLLGAAGSVSLTADNMGTAANPFGLDLQGGSLALSATGGDVYLRNYGGDFQTSQLTSFASTSTNQDVVLTVANGNLVVDTVAALNTGTSSNNLRLATLAANTNIEFTSAAAIVARSADINTLGEVVVSAGATANIDTSAANGDVVIVGQNIGAATTPLRIASGSGSLSLTATLGDIWMQRPSGNLSFSDFALLSAAATGAVIGLSTGNGSILVDGNVALAANTVNDRLQLVAGGATSDVVFTNTSAIAAESATITAGRAIVSVNNTLDLDLTGNATLTARTAIGTSAGQVNANVGGVLTAATVDSGAGIYIRSSAALKLGSVATNATSTEVVDIATTGAGSNSLTLTQTIAANDDWQLGAAGDFLLDPTVSLAAEAISVVAGGAISSGTENIDFNSAGALTLQGSGLGTSTDPLRIQAAGDLDLRAASDDIWIEYLGGDLLGSRIVALRADGAGKTISLTAVDGAITLDAVAQFDASTANDNFRLRTLAAGKDIVFTAPTALVAASANVNATGAILGSSGNTVVDINTSAANGAITLASINGVGALGAPLRVQAGSGLVSASSTAAGGDINLEATGSLTIGTLTTAAGSTQNVRLATTTGNDLTLDQSFTSNDNWQLTAGRDLVFSGNVTLTVNSATLAAGRDIKSGAANIDVALNASTGNVSLQGVNLGSSGNALGLDLKGGDLSLGVTGGDVYLQLYGGDFATSQITALSSTSTNKAVSLSVVNGGLAIDSVTALNGGTTSNNLQLATLAASKNIVFTATSALTAASVALSATGAVTVGPGLGTQLDTSAANGNISVSATSIGAMDERFRVSYGAGKLSLLASAGDIWLVRSVGDLKTSDFTLLSATAVGATVYLSVDAGDIVVDTTTNVLTANDTLILSTDLSGGDITFTGGGTLQAANATISSGGAILSPTTTLDLNVTGNLLLAASGPIGASTGQLNANVGGVLTVSTFSTGGNAYVRSGSALKLGTVTTAGGSTEIIDISTTGGATSDLTLTTAIVGNDDWRLNSSGDVVVQGTANLAAAAISVVAQDQIVSGSGTIDFDTSSANGALSLDAGTIGAAGNPVTFASGTGALSAISRVGDLWLQLAAGDLVLSQFSSISALGNGVNVGLSTTAGSIIVDSVAGIAASLANDKLHLTARGATSDVVFLAGPLVVAEATVNAGRNIVAGNPILAIDTRASNGPITLIAGGGIGLTFDFRVAAGTGAVTATTRGIGSAGNIYLQSDSALTLGQITTDVATSQTVFIATAANQSLTVTTSHVSNDFYLLNSGSDLVFSATGALSAASVQLSAVGGIIANSSGTQIDVSNFGGAVTVIGTSIGASGQNLKVLLGSGTLAMRATAGDIWVAAPTGDFATSQITFALLDQAGSTLSLRAMQGDLLVNGSAGFDPSLSAANLRLTTGGAGNDIIWSNGASLTAASVIVNATGAIVRSGAAGFDLQAVAGGVDLTATNAIGTTGEALRLRSAGLVQGTTTAANGNIYLQSDTALRLGLLTTAAGSRQQVSARTIGGAAIPLTVEAAELTNDDWQLFADGTLSFLGAGRIVAASFEGTAGSTITSGAAAIDIDTSASNGAISLNGAALGAAGDAMQLKAGSGDLRFVASSGDVWVNLTSGNLLGSKLAQLDVVGVGRVIALSTSGGGVTLDTLAGVSANTSDDFFVITTTALNSDIRFGADPLTAAGVMLSAAGKVVGGNGPLDIDTSALNGAIVVHGAGGIGANSTPLQLRAGQGLVTLASDQAAGHVFVESLGQLSLGAVTTDGGSAQDVSVVSTGAGANLQLFASNITNDRWRLTAGGDVISAGQTLAGSSFEIAAAGAIVGSGGALQFDTAVANGRIALAARNIGAAGSSVTISAGSGQLAFRASDGDVHVDLVAGELLTSRMTQLEAVRAGATVRLTAAGRVVFDGMSGFAANLADDRLEFASGAGNNIEFRSETLRGNSVLLESGGAIVGGSAAADVSTAAGGTTMLRATTTIGDAANPFIAQGGRLSSDSGSDQRYASPNINTLVGDLRSTAMVYFERGVFQLDRGSISRLSIRDGAGMTGSGSILDSLTVEQGGRLTLGTQTDTTGILTVNGRTELQRGSVLAMDLVPPYVQAGSDFDQIVVGGTLLVDGAILQLNGSNVLQTQVGDITLINVTDPGVRVQGEFARGVGSVGPDGRVQVGTFRSRLFTDGGDGNDVALREITITPPIQNAAFVLPTSQYVNARADVTPVPPRPPIGVTAKRLDSQFIEPEIDDTQTRFVVVMRLTPRADGQGFDEEPLMRINEEWLKDLAAIFRRLPDDRYRLNLVIEGGEQRRVMDVVVRDGRPFEPQDAIAEAPLERTQDSESPANSSGLKQDSTPRTPQSAPPALPDINLDAPSLAPPGNGREQTLWHDAPRRTRNWGPEVAAVAVAAAAAYKSAPAKSRDDEQEQIALKVGKSRSKSGRWWRWS